MIVVRKPDLNLNQRAFSFQSALACVVLLFLYSCNPTSTLTPESTRGNSSDNSDGNLTGKAYVTKESPYILGGKNVNRATVNISKYVASTPATITENNQLTSNCTVNLFFYANYSDSVENCVRSFALETEVTPLARPADKSWRFTTGSNEFYAVSTLYHINIGLSTFFKKLEFAYNALQQQSTALPKSIPSYLKDSKMFWFKGVGNLDAQQFQTNYVSSYALCEFDNNASFSPAGLKLCFGSDATRSKFHVVQDPSVIYHEFGHAVGAVMLNLRNGTASTTHPFRSKLGNYGYSEASAINEGFADYFSYVNTKRTHFGEWAFGDPINQSRPMSENDPAHISGISTTSEGRLSYPQYLLYDPNYPTSPVEDEHYAGQIISHYLVALTESLKTNCGLTSDADGGHDTATSYVLMLLTETFSEAGDLNAKGVDAFGAPYSNSTIFFNNFDSTNSYIWAQYLNPVTFRKFSQIMAKNIYKYISSNFCTAFDKNKSEKLLDDYGLLLYKTYNNNGNSTKSRSFTYNSVVSSIPAQALTNVSEDNRRKSVLVSKTLVDISSKVSTSTTNPVGFYIIDNRSDMESLLAGLLYKGFPIPLSTNVTGVNYNNGNIKISPGEVVGIIPNLYNSSNSTMAGLHVLAQDWDHVHITDTTTGNFKPCVYDSDVTVDMGGEAGNTCTTTETEYKRNVKNTSTGLFPTAAVAPVCLVQLDDGNSTRWVSQNEFRKKQGLALADKDCLGFSTSGVSDADFSFNPHECLARFLPGAQDAFFSKVDSRQTFYESVVKNQDNAQFNVGNLLIMEVNKWIPPGTKFKCRLRVNFSNCSDCFADGANSNDDYQDSEFQGNKPFKVLNFDFDVND